MIQTAQERTGTKSPYLICSNDQLTNETEIKTLHETVTLALDLHRNGYTVGVLDARGMWVNWRTEAGLSAQPAVC